MKKTVLNFMIMFLFLAGYSSHLTANPFFWGVKYKKNDKQINASRQVQCGACNKYHYSDSAYCPGCQKVYSSTSSINARCGYCSHSFYFQPDYVMKICSRCQYRNLGKSSYCSECGFRMYHEMFFVECPSCMNHFEASSRYKGHKKIKCSHCRRKYDRNYNSCPYCKYNSQPVYETKHRKRKHKQKESKPYYPVQKRVLIGTFLKKDYSSEVKQFSINQYTDNRAFTKISINVAKIGKYTPILNTIKISHNGKWIEVPKGMRLREGLNEFSVAIPQNANEILFSLKHGADSQLQISIE